MISRQPRIYPHLVVNWLIFMAHHSDARGVQSDVLFAEIKPTEMPHTHTRDPTHTESGRDARRADERRFLVVAIEIDGM